MKQFHGVKALFNKQTPLSYHGLAAGLLTDLQDCHLFIYGNPDGTGSVQLAGLKLLPESLNYDSFDQRIDFTLQGKINRNDCVPLTYRLQGQQFSITGRCSMIGRVCGVDLYLSKTYSGLIGESVQQRISLPLKPLLDQLKALSDD